MKTNKILTVILITTMLTGFSGLFAGCNALGVHGNGKVVKQTRTVSSFNGIEVSGAFKIFLKQGTTEEVTVETDENIQSLVRTEVFGSTLQIEIKKPVSHLTTAKVYITVKDLRKIELSGAVDVFTEGSIQSPELRLESSGASDSRLDVQVKKLEIICSGAGNMKLSGSAADVRMDLSGASDIKAFDLLAETYDIEISGAGDAQINVSKKIRAEISGAGSVKYKGSPSDIDQSISGAGSIKKVE